MEVSRPAPQGERAMLDRLVPVVYAELRHMAASYLRQENPGHTLQPTALVHEAYLKIVGSKQPDYASRAHFYGVASRAMREILVDHARSRMAVKRGGGACNVPLEDALAMYHDRPQLMVELDSALEALGRHDPDKLRLVELRFFAGLTAEESAELTGLPVTTVRFHLRLAQAWLRRDMSPSRNGD